MANGYVQSPGDVVKEGDEVKAAVIKVNRKKRRIDLSIKALEAPPEPVAAAQVQEDEPQEYVPNAMEIAFRRAYDTAGEEFPEQRREKSGDRRRFDKKSTRRDRQREMDDIFERTLRGDSRK